MTGFIRLDLPSTGELALVGATDEWVDTGQPGSDPTIPIPRELPVTSIKIPPPPADVEPKRELELDLSALPGGAGLVIHQLGDTKFRRIRYRAIATSRYAEYFPAGGGDLTRASESFEVVVPSTAPPIQIVVRPMS